MIRNYHSISNNTVFDSKMKDEQFSEYRRKWIENPIHYIVNPFPLNIDIESTNRCNLKCPNCARSSDCWGNNGIGDMDFHTYKKIIDEGKTNGLYAIKLSIRGEPLLHKNISKMVKYAKENNVKDVYFNTNGMNLNTKTIEKLIDAKLDRISISIDGLTKEEFLQFRPTADLDKIVWNITNLIEIKKGLGVSYPKIRIQSVSTPSVKLYPDIYKQKWQVYADEIGYVDLRKEGNQYNHRGVIALNWSCPFLWQRMAVLYNGDINPCHLYGIKDTHKYKLGNVKTDNIKDIWNGELMNGYRLLHKMGKSHLLDMCDQCSYRAFEIKK